MLLSISMTHRIFIFMIIVMSMAIFTLATLDDALSRSVVTLTSSDNLKDKCARRLAQRACFKTPALGRGLGQREPVLKRRPWAGALGSPAPPLHAPAPMRAPGPTAPSPLPPPAPPTFIFGFFGKSPPCQFTNGNRNRNHFENPAFL